MKKYENYSSFPETVDPLIFFQDIDIPHQEIYNRFRQMISDGQYTAALKYINSQDDTDGYFSDLYNLLEERILNLQYHLKCMDNRIIYTDTVPRTNYPYLHANVIWLNYNRSTGQTAPDSQDAQVNELVRENMEIRFVDEVSVSDNTKSVHAVTPFSTVCFEDIYISEDESMKENLLALKSSDVVWFSHKGFTRNEDLVKIIVSDDPVGTSDDYAPVNDILGATVDGEIKVLTTKSGKKIRLYPDGEPISRVIIYNTYGEKLGSYSYPRRESKEKSDYCLGYKNSDDMEALYTKSGELISIKFSELSLVPDSNGEYRHAKFRIMANLPTMLWHRLSFVTDENDAIVDEDTTVKEYLDKFLDHVEMNAKRIISAYKSLGVNGNVTDITGAITDYVLKKEDIVDAIEEVTEDVAHLDEDSSPTGIATYILNKMYTPVIDAVRRAAVRKGISMSSENTMVNAIETLKKFIVRFVGISDGLGNTYVLATKSGQKIRLKGVV